MHDFFSREPDPLESMLRPPPPDNEALRQQLYPRTQRVLHRRRRVRQLAYAAALLIAFAAGLLAMRLNAPPPPAPNVPIPVAGKDEAKPIDPFPLPPSPTSNDSARAREWIAFDSDEHHSELYRQAGDRYVTEENDLESALRCYGNALDGGSEQDLTISADDNYLLMAIKNARQKERNHAKQGG